MRISRRAFAAGAAGLIAAPSRARAQARELVFTSWGGAYQDAIRRAWLEPWSRRTGVRVREDTNPEIARIKAMVDTNSVSWDVVTGGGATLMQGMDANLFEPVPAGRVSMDHVFPQARHSHAVPSEIFSTVFAFSRRAFPDGRPQPANWADFFDVQKFPGKRSVYDRPQSVLEAALMAEGVAPAQVYQVLGTREGQDRAFNKLAALKPHVAQWWRSGAQPVQVLGSGETVMSLGWNGRFQAGIDEGLQIKMVFEGQVAQLGFFMVVKGARNRDTAFDFLNHMVSVEAQAEFYKYIMYGPVTPQAFDRIPRDKWENLPGSPAARIECFLDIPWWARMNQAMMERYQAFIQS